MKEYIPALEFNKEDFFEKFDKPYWKIKSKVPIAEIKIDIEKFSFKNPIYQEII